MKVCLIRGSGVEQHEVDDVFHAMEARQVEGVELKRDADAATTAELLKGTDLILTLGGDGTFLAGARVAAPREISILGRRTFVRQMDLAGESRILRMEIDVGGQRVGVIDADGAIVATASGSTAYALASGGPILEPTLEDLLLVPMSPFALTVRPIVFAPGQDISLSVLRGPGEMRVDGQGRGHEVSVGDVVRCGSHTKRLKVVRFSPPESFYQRLGEKLGWGRPLVPKK